MILPPRQGLLLERQLPEISARWSPRRSPMRGDEDGLPPTSPSAALRERVGTTTDADRPGFERHRLDAARDLHLALDSTPLAALAASSAA